MTKNSTICISVNIDKLIGGAPINLFNMFLYLCCINIVDLKCDLPAMFDQFDKIPMYKIPIYGFDTTQQKKQRCPIIQIPFDKILGAHSIFTKYFA